MRALKRRTPNITIGEAEGGYNGYRVADAFTGHGLDELAAREQINVVNLTPLPSETVTGVVGRRAVSVSLPSS